MQLSSRWRCMRTTERFIRQLASAVVSSPVAERASIAVVRLASASSIRPPCMRRAPSCPPSRATVSACRPPRANASRHSASAAAGSPVCTRT